MAEKIDFKALALQARKLKQYAPILYLEELFSGADKAQEVVANLEGRISSLQNQITDQINQLEMSRNRVNSEMNELDARLGKKKDDIAAAIEAESKSLEDHRRAIGEEAANVSREHADTKVNLNKQKDDLLAEINELKQEKDNIQLELDQLKQRIGIKG